VLSFRLAFGTPVIASVQKKNIRSLYDCELNFLSSGMICLLKHGRSSSDWITKQTLIEQAHKNLYCPFLPLSPRKKYYSNSPGYGIVETNI